MLVGLNKVLCSTAVVLIQGNVPAPQNVPTENDILLCSWAFRLGILRSCSALHRRSSLWSSIVDYWDLQVSTISYTRSMSRLLISHITSICEHTRVLEYIDVPAEIISTLYRINSSRTKKGDELVFSNFFLGSVRTKYFLVLGSLEIINVWGYVKAPAHGEVRNIPRKKDVPPPVNNPAFAVNSPFVNVPTAMSIS